MYEYIHESTSPTYLLPYCFPDHRLSMNSGKISVFHRRETSVSRGIKASNACNTEQ